MPKDAGRKGNLQKIQSIVKSINSRKAKGILIKHSSNILYLTGYSGGESYLFVSNEGEVFLYIDGRYYERAIKETKNNVNANIIVNINADVNSNMNLPNTNKSANNININANTNTNININININVICIKDIYKDISADLNSRLKLCQKDMILFESFYFSYEEYLGFKKELKYLKFAPAHNLISKLRGVKTQEEINNIKEAISIAENAMINAINKLKEFNLNNNLLNNNLLINSSLNPLLLNNNIVNYNPDEKIYEKNKINSISELDIANAYKINLLNRQASESFETIILSAERSAMPHGSASNRIINKNSIILCDFGATYNFYKSDETITLFLGKSEKRFIDIHETVYAAQQLAISKIKPGLKFKELDKFARDYIENKGYGKYFTHSLGHGVGLDIHEYPNVSYKNEDRVKEGMVFTIEPGIYIEGFGGVRLEDMCAVEKDGARVLTTIKKDYY